MQTRTNLAATVMTVMLALCSCDRSPESLVQTGQNARDEAREVVAIDADQKITLSRQLISAGKAAEAQQILDELNQNAARLPQATQEKLQAALKELEQAKGSR